MDDHAPMSGDQPVNDKAAAGLRQQRNAAPRQGNLLAEVIKTRKEERYSRAALGRKAGVSAVTLSRLERGDGSVATLVRVMEALCFHPAGIGPGATLAEQLLKRRLKLGMTIDDVAARTSLSSRQIVALEAGAGSVRSLLALLGVIAPKVRRRAPERVFWGQGKKADRDSHFTPDSFMRPVYTSFGSVDVDPCGHEASPVVARRRFLLTKGEDGLVKPWSDPSGPARLAFVNPPFSAVDDWFRRGHSEWQDGNVKTVVWLVPVRTDLAFFHDHLVGAADFFPIRGRIKFINGAGKAQSTPFALMVVALGATVAQKARFAAQVQGFWVNADNVSRAVQHEVAMMAAPGRRSRRDRRSCAFRWSDDYVSCAASNARNVICNPTRT